MELRLRTKLVVYLPEIPAIMGHIGSNISITRTPSKIWYSGCKVVFDLCGPDKVEIIKDGERGILL